MSGDTSDLFPGLADVGMEDGDQVSTEVNEGAFEGEPQDVKPSLLDMELVPEGTMSWIQLNLCLPWMNDPWRRS